jgi:hypothetical protein
VVTDTNTGNVVIGKGRSKVGMGLEKAAEEIGGAAGSEETASCGWTIHWS